MKKGVHLTQNKIAFILKDGSQIVHNLVFHEKKSYKFLKSKEHQYIFMVKVQKN